jgi:hypothetical protein
MQMGGHFKNTQSLPHPSDQSQLLHMFSVFGFNPLLKALKYCFLYENYFTKISSVNKINKKQNINLICKTKQKFNIIKIKKI